MTLLERLDAVIEDIKKDLAYDPTRRYHTSIIRELHAIIDEIKKRDEAVRKVAEDLEAMPRGMNPAGCMDPKHECAARLREAL